MKPRMDKFRIRERLLFGALPKVSLPNIVCYGSRSPRKTLSHTCEHLLSPQGFRVDLRIFRGSFANLSRTEKRTYTSKTAKRILARRAVVPRDGRTTDCMIASNFVLELRSEEMLLELELF
jgi:hypothetical protein